MFIIGLVYRRLIAYNYTNRFTVNFFKKIILKLLYSKISKKKKNMLWAPQYLLLSPFLIIPKISLILVVGINENIGGSEEWKIFSNYHWWEHALSNSKCECEWICKSFFYSIEIIRFLVSINSSTDKFDISFRNQTQKQSNVFQLRDSFQNVSAWMNCLVDKIIIHAFATRTNRIKPKNHVKLWFEIQLKKLEMSFVASMGRGGRFTS